MAGELALLRRRADSLRDRPYELRDVDTSAIKDLGTELEVELRHLGKAFERWLANRLRPALQVSTNVCLTVE